MGKNLNSEHWGLGIGDYCVLLLPLEDILQKQDKNVKKLDSVQSKNNHRERENARDAARAPMKRE